MDEKPRQQPRIFSTARAELFGWLPLLILWAGCGGGDVQPGNVYLTELNHVTIEITPLPKTNVRTRFGQAESQKEFGELEFDSSRVSILGDQLKINGTQYGTINPGDVLRLDHAAVIVNGSPRGPAE